jgi:hypothetical protein
VFRTTSRFAVLAATAFMAVGEGGDLKVKA